MTGKHKPGAKSPAEIDAELKRMKPLFEQMYAARDKDDQIWQEEISLLESRVSIAYQEVELPGGGTIRIRTCLTGPEMKRLGELEEKRIEAGHKGDISGMNLAIYEIVEIVTANPLINVEYLKKNPDKYSGIDITTIGLGYYEGQVKALQERAEKVRRARTFRQDSEGAGIRPVPQDIRVQEP